jgi:hypothetical protein
MAIIGPIFARAVKGGDSSVPTCERRDAAISSVSKMLPGKGPQTGQVIPLAIASRISWRVSRCASSSVNILTSVVTEEDRAVAEAARTEGVLKFR